MHCILKKNLVMLTPACSKYWLNCWDEVLTVGTVEKSRGPAQPCSDCDNPRDGQDIQRQRSLYPQPRLPSPQQHLFTTLGGRYSPLVLTLLLVHSHWRIIHCIGLCVGQVQSFGTDTVSCSQPLESSTLYL